MTNAEVVDRFRVEYQEYNNISDERARQQRKLLLEFGLTVELTSASADDVRKLAATWVASGLHVNTVRKRLNMVRPFFSWCYAVKLITPEQYMDIRTVKNPRGSRPTSKPRPYKRAEIIELWETLDERFPYVPASGPGSQAIPYFMSGRGLWRRVWRHAMRLQLEYAIRLALDMGLRRNEMFRLTVDDGHFDNEYIPVVGKADPTTGEPKVRLVPFTAEAREAGRRWLTFRDAVLKPEHNSVWCSCWGSSSYNNPMLEKRFAELLQSVLGPGWAWHRLRHTCATNWVRSGAKLEVVQVLLGHATLQQTLAYAEIAEQDVAKGMAKAEAEFAALSGRAA